MLTRCTLITGFPGAGKTSLIRHLLRNRGSGERWAVIVNAANADAQALVAQSTRPGAQPVSVREVAGGCICCAASLPLRVAIVDVLRRLRPHRLLIEPEGLARPAPILAVLGEPGIAPAVTVDPPVCVVDARAQTSVAATATGLHPGAIASAPAGPAARGTGSAGAGVHDDTWRDQIAGAGLIVANKADLADEHARARFVALLAALPSAPPALAWACHGEIDPGLLAQAITGH